MEPKQGVSIQSKLVQGHRQTVSEALNALKAKTYNLIETCGVSEKQQDAMKDLYRGFSSDAFKRIGEGIIEDVNYPYPTDFVWADAGEVPGIDWLYIGNENDSAFVR